MELSVGYLISTIYHKILRTTECEQSHHTLSNNVSSSYYYLNYLLQTI